MVCICVFVCVDEQDREEVRIYCLSINVLGAAFTRVFRSFIFMSRLCRSCASNPPNEDVIAVKTSLCLLEIAHVASILKTEPSVVPLIISNDGGKCIMNV